jgi:hypothetical protein
MPLQSGLLIMFYFKTIACSVYKAKRFLEYFDYDDWLGKSKLWLWPTDIDGLNRLTLIILIK